MADQINPGAFRVMCDMWCLDAALEHARLMGVTVSDDLIREQREREKEVQARWDRVVKDVMMRDEG